MTIVGALSVLVSGFYLWAIHLAAQTDPTLTTPPGWAYATWIAGTVTSAALLWWHQRHPILVFTGVFVLHLTGAVLIGNGGLGGVALPLWFSVYALATFARPLIAGILVAGAWAIATTVQLVLAATAGLSLSAPEVVVVAFGQGFFFLACYLIGVGMRAERQRARDAAERAQLIEARTRAEAAGAVSRERNRMARELHDLAAHQIMDVLLTTRAALLTDPNPVLEEVEQKTAEALGSIRSVVGALRDGDTDPSSSEPEPLTDAATRAIERVARERGLHVQERVTISHEPESAATATVVSVLTEALVNAATHAPGAPVAVTLHSDSTAVRLEVRNPMGLGEGQNPRLADSGYGLIGAAERAHILSGQLDTGIAENGDWTLTLTLPATRSEALR
ncbi:sensor histidine kinase [Mycetocola reblochoni]|uniref:sensor histidine kinase n=1 Tax=Mycetocola reblochoni TaxID=331618 RepID=UPI003F95D447